MGHHFIAPDRYNIQIYKIKQDGKTQYVLEYIEKKKNVKKDVYSNTIKVMEASVKEIQKRMGVIDIRLHAIVPWNKKYKTNPMTIGYTLVGSREAISTIISAEFLAWSYAADLKIKDLLVMSIPSSIT